MRGRWVRGALVALVTSVALVGPASASTARAGGLPSPYEDAAAPLIPSAVGVPAAQAWLEGALALRASALSRFGVIATATKGLTSVQRASLEGLLTSASSGIASLGSKAPSDTTIAEVRADASTMVLDYHVLSVIGPTVKGLAGVETELASAAVLAQVEPSIQAAIATDAQAHKNVSRARRLYVDVVSKLDAVTNGEAPLPAELLAVSPSSYPAPLGVIDSTKATVLAGAADIVTARLEIKQIVAFLARPAASSSVRRQAATIAGRLATAP